MTLHYTNLDELADISTPQQVNPRPRRYRGVYRNGLKRAFDTLIIVMALPFVLPVLAAMICLVARDGGKPFYSQTRIGRDGRRFRMWKMRTMVTDADQRLAAYLAADPAARREWDSTQKLKNDPRITRIGSFLRKTSLDELPQLWNVVNGTMSLVGPRPMMVDQQSIYFGQGYYNLRPGITGFWQVSDRNEGTFCGRVDFDDAYDRELSFSTDVAVLARTFGVVLRCTGY